jgi:hypothetical protein
MKFFGLCIFFVVSFFNANLAFGASFIPLSVSTKASGGQLADGKIYAIDITCEKRGDLRNAIDRSIFSTNTRTHAIIVSTAPSTKTPDGTDKLPESALAAVQVFSVDKSTTFTDRRDCDHHFLIAGGKRYYIVAAINVLDDYANSPAGTVFSNLAALAAPLFSLFTGNPLPALVASKVSNLQAVQGPIQNILGVLNSGKNYTKIIENLKVGSYSVLTDYSLVTIKIRSVPSIVLDPNTTFRTDFRAQIDAAPDKIDINNIEQSCQGIRSGLTEGSFTSRTDIAYALIALGAKAKFNQDQIIHCVTRDYAPNAIAMPDSAWLSFPAEIRFTTDDVDRVLPPPSWPQQPSFAAIKSRLDQFVVSLAQYAQSDPPPPPVAIKNLTQLAADTLQVVDRTSDLRISGSVDPIDRLKAFDTFISKGYIRVGCYAATTEATDQSVDGATSMFLMFKAPKDAASTTIDKIIVVRPIYSKLQIASLGISVNRAYATAVLTARDYDCNGFTVERPK